MPYDVKLEDGTAQLTACAHETLPQGDLSAIFPRLIGEVFGYLERNGLHPSGPPYARSTWLPGTDLEVGFPVAQPIDGDGRVVPGELPGGQRAVTLHIGPYSELRGAYEAVMVWVAGQGLEIAGGSWETYLSDPAVVTDPAQYQTIVAIPVRKKG
jgi:effector-binding domain-containing protein